MTEHVSMHAVLMFIGAGVATIGVAFVLYWKLLAQQHCRKIVSAKKVVISRSRETTAPAAVPGKGCALPHACK